MKITASRVKRELEKNYGWMNIDTRCDYYEAIIFNELIKDTLSVVNDILLTQKQISIKK